MKNFFNGITAKILLIFGCLLIPMYVLLVISAKSYLNSQEASAVNAAEGILGLNMNSLEAECGQIDYGFYDLQEYDSNYSRLCEWTGSSADYLAWFGVNRSLNSLSYACEFQDALFVYMDQTQEMLIAFSQTDQEDKALIKKAIQDSGIMGRNTKWQVRELNGTAYLLHTSGYYGVYTGVLINMDAFMDRVKEQIGYPGTLVTIDDTPSVAEDGKSVTVSAQIRQTGQYIHVTLDKREIGIAMPRIVRLTYRVALLFILVFPVLFLVLWHMIVKPVKTIEEGLTRLKQGQQEYRIPAFKAAREFESLRDSFNAMAGEIQSLKIASYEEQLEKKQMALQNLMLQIRPHFMLNILNQIFSMAQLKDFEGIQKMSMYLSKFFRYLFRSGKIATLRSELELVQDYLEMMELRFLDCFEVETDIDESLLEYRIPPLMVHNFVENIFKYAVSEGNLITIRITLRRERDSVALMVADDGPGIEPEILEKIRAMQPIDKEDGTHIGIYNSAYRLKTLCGEDCQLQVESVLTEGTTVRILLPA